MINEQFFDMYKRVRNMLVVLAIFCVSDVCLGISDIRKESISQYDKKTIYHLNMKAQQGDDEAQFKLGVIYLKGDGVKQDYKKAFKWYKKSAEQGNARAQNNLVGCIQKVTV
ncbi:hypothetical protein AGMMS49950_10680 [Endomicrobiia bacterium]|nr:hypothetical protein AGMMS49950_10680 [Endomicrobiia bacterium]